VPTDFPFEDFKDIYLYAYESKLKGCTTFRFNPEAFQGVLVKEEDLKNTTYRFELEDGEVVEVKGNEEIEYDGETHTAANLYDALKEGYYGRFYNPWPATPSRRQPARPAGGEDASKVVRCTRSWSARRCCSAPPTRSRPRSPSTPCT
jgi:ribonucleotide reductase alpha subunit